MPKAKSLTAPQRKDLLAILRERFKKNMDRHPGLEWSAVQARLEANPGKLWSVAEMERTGGEPDVVGGRDRSGEIRFWDCAPESPQGRRSLCYDRAALDARKKNKPQGNAVEAAAAMGIELLTEDQYRQLQQHGRFDQKTSSWVRTPAEIRDLGGALFCDRRYEHVFLYHNGAESYYAARGFRGMLKV